MCFKTTSFQTKFILFFKNGITQNYRTKYWHWNCTFHFIHYLILKFNSHYCENFNTTNESGVLKGTNVLLWYVKFDIYSTLKYSYLRPNLIRRLIYSEYHLQAVSCKEFILKEDKFNNSETDAQLFQASVCPSKYSKTYSILSLAHREPTPFLHY